MFRVAAYAVWFFLFFRLFENVITHGSIWSYILKFTLDLMEALNNISSKPTTHSKHQITFQTFNIVQQLNLVQKLKVRTIELYIGNILYFSILFCFWSLAGIIFKQVRAIGCFDHPKLILISTSRRFWCAHPQSRGSHIFEIFYGPTVGALKAESPKRTFSKNSPK